MTSLIDRLSASERECLEEGPRPEWTAPMLARLTWVQPKLIGEFGFTEWTKGGKLRHPRFLGLCRDKKPRDVGRERPGAAP